MRQVLVGVVFLMALVAMGQDQALIEVSVDGKIIDFDTPPLIVDGRTMAPLRPSFQAMGLHVEWADEDKSITVSGQAIDIWLQVDNPVALVNQEEVTLDVAAFIYQGAPTIFGTKRRL